MRFRNRYETAALLDSNREHWKDSIRWAWRTRCSRHRALPLFEHVYGNSADDPRHLRYPHVTYRGVCSEADQGVDENHTRARSSHITNGNLRAKHSSHRGRRRGRAHACERSRFAWQSVSRDRSAAGTRARVARAASVPVHCWPSTNSGWSSLCSPLQNNNHPSFANISVARWSGNETWRRCLATHTRPC